MNTWGSKELEAKNIDLLLQRRIDDLILYPSGQKLSPLTYIPCDRIPVVVVDIGIAELQCDQVLLDNANAIYEAGVWLKSQNHRKIGIINGTLDYFTSGERFEGYKRFHEVYSIKLDKDLIHNIGYSQAAGYESLQVIEGSTCGINKYICQVPSWNELLSHKNRKGAPGFKI